MAHEGGRVVVARLGRASADSRHRGRGGDRQAGVEPGWTVCTGAACLHAKVAVRVARFVGVWTIVVSSAALGWGNGRRDFRRVTTLSGLHGNSSIRPTFRVVFTIAFECGVEVARRQYEQRKDGASRCSAGLHGKSPATAIMPPPGMGSAEAAMAGLSEERVMNPMRPVVSPTTATPESTMLASCQF